MEMICERKEKRRKILKEEIKRKIFYTGERIGHLLVGKG